MRRLLNVLGELIDAVTGPSETHLVPEPYPNQIRRYHPSTLSEDESVYVQSRKRLYCTRRTRWWIPDRYSAYYEVSGHADCKLASRLPPAFFDTVIYPNLGNPLLRDTEYPHLYAIQAFMARIGSTVVEGLLEA